MYSLTQLQASAPRFVIALVLACFAHLPIAQALNPPPDGGYPGFTTAEGSNALNSLTTGSGNTAIGWHSLFSNTDGSFNTAVGVGTLLLNIGTVDPQFPGGNQNTAVGAAALLSNTTGNGNTAVGVSALLSNQYGFANVAVGGGALESNGGGSANTAVGSDALFHNLGEDVFGSGYSNTAVGADALFSNQSGRNNTALGEAALFANTGNNNTGLGFQAGNLATTGDGNVYIGAQMSGIAGESNHTYIRNVKDTILSGGGTDYVTVNLTTGLIGHLTSSRRYKEQIKPMNDASERLFALKPVTFRYKKEIDQTQTLEYGLIAEEVAKIDSSLAIRDKNGQIESVRYTAINAMLLNEFIKEHKAFLEEQKKVRKLEAALAIVNHQLKEQAAQIQSVSSRLELTKATPTLVRGNP